MHAQENTRTAGRYEDVDMSDSTLPVRVLMRRTGRESFGCDFHWHEELEFYYVTQGGVLLLCGGQAAVAARGGGGLCQLVPAAPRRGIP